MKWINFLHFYQPANSDHLIIKEALDKSYYRLVRLMEENSNLHMTWNISGCLLERLKDAGENDFIVRVRKLIENGQVEITSTAAYHAFLPLIPEKEVIYQIKKNEKILQDILGLENKPEGFFLPEMAYSSEVAKVVKELGYKWIIVDEYSCANNEQLQDSDIFVDKDSGLKVVFRNRLISTSYPPVVVKDLISKEEERKVIITATDAELYGLRHEDHDADVEKVAAMKELETYTISGFIESKEREIKAKEVKLVASSWETLSEDLKNDKPFILWNDRDNEIHQTLWKFTNFIISLDEKVRNDDNYYWYRWHLVRGIASCTYWWASAYDFSKVFGPHAWNPDGIERGIVDMVKAVRSLDDFETKEFKLEAEKYYLTINKLIWEEHWSKHWHK